VFSMEEKMVVGPAMVPDKMIIRRNEITGEVYYVYFTAETIKKLGGSIWRINRHNLNAVNGHPSEHAMDSYMVSHVIYNDGTLDDLSDEVFMLAKELDLDK